MKARRGGAKGESGTCPIAPPLFLPNGSAKRFRMVSPFDKFIFNRRFDELPHVGRLVNAKAYLYLCRQWFVGGQDIAMVWVGENGQGRRFCEGTGQWNMLDSDEPPRS